MRLMKAIGIALLAVSAAAAANARTLHWKSIQVKATLDADGLLHVSERQNMIFDGDWNGGERKFRVEPGQNLTLARVERIDPQSGERFAMAEGDLDAVDHYRMVDAKTLRWRSRLPSDPPFANRELDYALDYTLSGVLERRGAEYRLAHDFAFADRDGPIDHFSLDLELDPAWQAAGPLPGHFEADSLAPGRGYVVRASLRSNRPTPPAAVRSIPLLADRSLALLLIVAAVLVFGLHYWLHDRARGRFAPLPPLSAVDAAWLDTNVFDLRPEEVGTAIDDDVGSPEVAAVIARLVGEKKLKSETVPPPAGHGKAVLRLTRLVPLSQFSGYERKLIDGLFFGNDTVTPEEVRAHYRSSGFDPGKLIAEDLKKSVASKGEFAGTYKPAQKWRSLFFFLLAVGFGVATFRHHLANDPRAVFAFLFSSAFCAGLGIMLASRSAESFSPLNGPLAFAIPLVLVPWGIAGKLLPADYSPTLFAAFTFLTLMYVSSAFHMAMSRDTSTRMQARRRLATAKKWFIAQLKNAHPKLEDSWFPYLLALGLGPRVDRWSKSFSGVSSGGGGTSFGGSHSSSSTSGGSWTGGGGSFGGAGASGGWAAAVGGFAAGVAAPSSSSSGGGGSSSGGGGGGGW